ncbi:YciI family protein [Tenggerimyces flavus]|uniref:YciI family protein n=1 Tax=Tenggerimyces flavus TaxID=1708749 RepID=A0ABV7YNT5_9ACTN|nr:YciI family protein [Tenggerimyces flavus]MBM7786288.1 uncharacterized protein YciI [Tenggerimyces flavus]
MHALIAMTPTGQHETDELQGAHEEFIGALERDHRVILGGELKPPLAGHLGAYVVRCRDLEEAQRLAEQDPLAKSGAITVQAYEWQLVGVDPEAVDKDALLFP